MDNNKIHLLNDCMCICLYGTHGRPQEGQGGGGGAFANKFENITWKIQNGKYKMNKIT